MTLLLTAVLLAIGFTILAIQNTTAVSLQAGGYIFPSIPLYMIILASFFFGLFIAWIFGSISWISSNMTLHNKDNIIKDKNREITKLQKHIEDLEQDKHVLRNEKEEVIHDHQKHPNLVNRIRYNLS